MTTPIFDFVTRYIDLGVSRLHMPGHKGVGPLGCEARDITEIAARYDFYDEARSAILQLRDMGPIGLLSNAMPSIKRVFDNAGLLELFDDVVISCEIGAQKPSEKMYATICERMEVEPGDCIFVDDVIANLEAAEKFGMQGVHMCREGESDWHGIIVRDLTEVVRLAREK